MAKVDPDKLAHAERLLLDGAKVAPAATESEVSYVTVKKLRERLIAEGRIIAQDTVVARALGSAPLADDLYDLTLQVPAGKADLIFSTFTVEEKLNAISNVLQDRLNLALGEEGKEDPDNDS